VALPPAPTPPSSPPTEAEQRDGPNVFRFALVGVAVLAIWTVSSVLALRAFGPYPPRSARPALLLSGVASGVAALLLAWIWTAGKAAIVCVVAAAVLPILMVAWIPGIAPAEEHALASGTTIVNAAAPYGNFDLYITPGGDPDRRIQLTDTTATERYPHLSPDGTKVSYAVEQPDGTNDIAVMDLDSTGHPVGSTTIVDRPGSLEDQSWSPDGRYILIASLDRSGRSSVYRYDTVTGLLVPWVRNAWNPIYSPNGEHIAVARVTQRGDQDIYVTDADGTDARRVAATPVNDWVPQWSPDGTRIAFTSGNDRDSDVYLVPADGSTPPVDVTPNSQDEDVTYQWTAPDELLVLSDRSHTGGVFIYALSPSTGTTTLFQRL
jgi:dipeptidyl aminopeptidase/acylaminoacyl peptidase